MLVIVQIETPVGVANAYDIAMVPGVDVLLGSNGDMTNFSGLQPEHPEYQGVFREDPRRDAQGRQVSRRRDRDLRQAGRGRCRPGRLRRLEALYNGPPSTATSRRGAGTPGNEAPG